jgi:hypothetical protein
MPAAVTALKPEQKFIQGIGTALSCDSKTILVSMDQGIFKAKQALSCLVAPEQNDRVLVAGVPDTDLFVIAVLDSSENRPVALSIKGDCSMNVSHGKLNIAAEEGITLSSPKALAMEATDLSMNASRGRLVFGALNYIGNQLSAYSEKTTIVGAVFDSIMERVAQRLKRSYRVVEEVDYLRSNTIEYRAEKNLSLRGQNALIDADDLVRIDGDQIHLG